MGGLLLEITVANSRCWVLYKTNATNIEIYNYKTVIKPTTQSFHPRNVLKCRIIYKKNVNLILYCLEKNPMGFFSKLLLQTEEEGGADFFSIWSSSRD